MLPKQIRKLQCLETIDIIDASVTSIPSDVSHLASLRALRHLAIRTDLELPDGIGKLRALRTLRFFNLAKNSIYSRSQRVDQLPKRACSCQ